MPVQARSIRRRSRAKAIRCCAVGDLVFAGSTNGEGLLEVRSTRPACDSIFVRMEPLVAEAQSRRTRVEQRVERFARVYTSAVLVAALPTSSLPLLLFAGDWQEWLYRALIRLVLSCPCPLVIATPV